MTNPPNNLTSEPIDEILNRLELKADWRGRNSNEFGVTKSGVIKIAGKKQAKQAIQDYISKNYFTKEQILEFINGLEVQPHPDDQKYTDEIMRVMKIHARTKLEKL